jgi:hypothetical protein
MASEPQDGGPCMNTDRHLWPDVSDPLAERESIHVTAQGGIGINVGGYVYVKPLREWHKLAGGKEAMQPVRDSQPTVFTSNLVAAARELLRLKDLKTDANAINTSGSWEAVHRREAMLEEYRTKKGEAWDALRRALQVETSGRRPGCLRPVCAEEPGYCKTCTPAQTNCDGATPVRASTAEVVLPNTAEPTASPVHPSSDAAALELQCLLQEAVTLAEIGDITEDTEAHGWGAWLKQARSALKTSAPICSQCKTELAFEGDVCGLCFPVAQP